MLIGVPKEIKNQEYRVSITPSGAELLHRDGHRVLVETGAGEGAGLPDGEYRKAGAELVSREEAWAAQLVVKVKEPLPREYGFFRPDLILFTYLHLAAAPELALALQERGVLALAYETIQEPGGGLPCLAPMSQVAGRMAVQAGARFLEAPAGGSGVLLAGAPGAPRGRVAVLGAGMVGMSAVRLAVGLGAGVTVMDQDLARLRQVEDIFGSRVETLMPWPADLARVVASSDLFIGAVLVPGARAPRLVTRDMVRAMRPGSVVVDVSIDQGGCVEGIRPTTHDAPVFLADGVLHYGVTNMPGAVGRTSTFALTAATLPFVRRLAAGGPAALEGDPVLAGGLNVRGGKVVHPRVAEALAGGTAG